MDFSEALNIKTSDIERPPLPPMGHYRFVVDSYKFGEANSGDDSWDTVDFQLKAVEAQDDVDPEALTAAGGIKSISLRHSFMFTKAQDAEAAASNGQTLYRLKRFLTEHLGLDEKGSLKETIDSSKGAQCIADIVHKASKKDPETPFANIGRTAPVA